MSTHLHHFSDHFPGVTTCLENLEMSGNYTDVREMSGILLKVMGMSGKKSCHGKMPKSFHNCINRLCVTFIIFHYSVAVDVSGFYNVIL